jgi:hypothetical protein
MNRGQGSGVRSLGKACIAALLAAFALMGCSSTPKAPDWKVTAEGQLEAFQLRYLEGRVQTAQAAFDKALAAIAESGDLRLAARAHLIRCAMQVASADLGDCPEYEKYAKHGSSDEDRNYHQFILGNWQELNPKLLPEPYRALPAKAQDPAQMRKLIAEIKDPISRMVALGVQLRRGQFDDVMLQLALDTASERGFRRPLLTYLKMQEAALAKNGDSPVLETVRARIGLIEASHRGP